MNVLSLFDGISCARVALDRAGIPVTTYMASEICKYADKVSNKNYPDILRLGNVVDINIPQPFDLLIGGSPCQDLSIAKRGRQGLKGNRSSLFYKYLEIRDKYQPKYYILENVNSMSKEDKATITEEMAVEPVMLDASLVSAQSRKRLFWTNIPVLPMADKGIVLSDILLDNTYTEKLKSYPIDASYAKAGVWEYIDKNRRTCAWTKPIKVTQLGNGGQGNRVYSVDGKSVTLSSAGGGRGAKTGLYDIKGYARKLHPIECERLQGLPDNYTEGISDSRRYQVLGNAFNVDVVAHILRGIK